MPRQAWGLSGGVCARIGPPRGESTVPFVPCFLLNQCPKPEGPQGSALVAFTSQRGTLALDPAQEGGPYSAMNVPANPGWYLPLVLVVINWSESFNKYNNGKKPGARCLQLN